jgi:hypothetical protein
MTDQRQGRGRPPKPASARKRGNFTFRVTDEFRQKIRERAEKNGRSLSEEVEYLVQQSFDLAQRKTQLEEWRESMTRETRAKYNEAADKESYADSLRRQAQRELERVRAILDTARIQAIREAGFQIVRETLADGQSVTRALVSLEQLDSEADLRLAITKYRKPPESEGEKKESEKREQEGQEGKDTA